MDSILLVLEEETDDFALRLQALLEKARQQIVVATRIDDAYAILREGNVGIFIANVKKRGIDGLIERARHGGTRVFLTNGSSTTASDQTHGGAEHPALIDSPSPLVSGAAKN